MVELITRAQAEVVNRHRFFVEWFTGRASEAELEASLRAFAPDMVMIEPDANTIGRDDVVVMVSNARGKRPADFEIRVDLISARLIDSDTVAVVYDEHQVIAGEKSARRSSAVFSADPEAPEGVVWRHLQETWITT